MLRSLLHPQADIDHNTPSSSAPYSLILNRKNIAGLLDDKRYGKIVARQLNNLLKENQLPARDVQSILFWMKLVFQLKDILQFSGMLLFFHHFQIVKEVSLLNFSFQVHAETR